MLGVYFSGTGNSKYLAQRFCENMNASCRSIEEKVDFSLLFSMHDKIAFFYPIYGSCVPRIMREFVLAHKKDLDGKSIIIFCTQQLFSGDGARVFTDLLKGIKVDVLYAEHINMPSNIPNIFFLPVKNSNQVNDAVTKVNGKLDECCKDIKEGVVVRRGFNPGSRLVGALTQRKLFMACEKKLRGDVRSSADCIACGECVQICPMQNLTLENQKVEQKGNCTICYRCVNACPQKAITVMTHGRIKNQYKGILR